jgi:preprotein translocase subunit SecF
VDIAIKHAKFIRMTIIGKRKISFAISGVLLFFSVLSLSVWGLNLSIDFTGGSLMEIEYEEARPTSDQIITNLQAIGVEGAVVQLTGETGVIVRSPDLDEETHREALVALGEFGELREKRFNSIGPTIGAELRRRSLWTIGSVMIMIVLYISWAFRRVSRPMASWKYGIAAIVALVHDVAIPAGVFSVLGHFYGVEIDTLFVTALLTIFGFSVHDTIVVFDRIRENLKKLGGTDSFESIVDKSVVQIIPRSINTSLMILFVMGALYFFGGATTQFFALALIIGTFFGTYSSIFIASALLVSWHNFQYSRQG